MTPGVPCPWGEVRSAGLTPGRLLLHQWSHTPLSKIEGAYVPPPFGKPKGEAFRWSGDVKAGRGGRGACQRGVSCLRLHTVTPGFFCLHQPSAVKRCTDASSENLRALAGPSVPGSRCWLLFPVLVTWSPCSATGDMTCRPVHDSHKAAQPHSTRCTRSSRNRCTFTATDTQLASLAGTQLSFNGSGIRSRQSISTP